MMRWMFSHTTFLTVGAAEEGAAVVEGGRVAGAAPPGVDPGVVLDGAGCVRSEGVSEVLVERLGNIVAERREGVVELDEFVLPQEEVDGVAGQLEVVVPVERVRHGVGGVVDFELVPGGPVEEGDALRDGCRRDADGDVVVAVDCRRVADVPVEDDGVVGLLDREAPGREPSVLRCLPAAAAARERYVRSQSNRR